MTGGLLPTSLLGASLERGPQLLREVVTDGVIVPVVLPQLGLTLGLLSFAPVCDARTPQDTRRGAGVWRVSRARPPQLSQPGRSEPRAKLAAPRCALGASLKDSG